MLEKVLDLWVTWYRKEIEMTLVKVKSRGTDNVSGRRNLLINGAMQIAQRGASTSFAHDGTTSGYSPDRWQMSLGGTHEQLDGTVAQVADNPLGGTGKSLKWTTGTPESSYDADEYAYFTQKVEAQNLNHIQNGNSNAKKLTLSFYVKSSITGTYAVGLYKPDNTGRIFNKTYTISSANTWEKKSVTFVGDTAGGGIVNDNGQGLWVSWHLAVGSNYSGGDSTSGWSNYSNDRWATGQAANVMTTASATWQMTECQLEVGDGASEFEHLSFAEELPLCQRYYYRTPSYINSGLGANESIATGNMDGSAVGAFLVRFPQIMRDAPTAFEQSGTASNYSIRVTSDANGTAVPISGDFTSDSAFVNLTSSGAGFTSGAGAFLRAESPNAFLAWSAEL